MKTETMQKKLGTIEAIAKLVQHGSMSFPFEQGELNRTLKILHRRADQLKQHLALKAMKNEP